MSEVALQIGGRTYRVACAPGEEERVTRLGATIAEKLDSIGNPSGPDAQNLLFAALLLADEVQETREDGATSHASVDANRHDAELASAREQIGAMESEIARLKSNQQAAADEIAAHEAQVAALQVELASSRSTLLAPGETNPMEQLAPALEKFAEMLEDCADKLERRAPAP